MELFIPKRVTPRLYRIDVKDPVRIEGRCVYHATVHQLLESKMLCFEVSMLRSTIGDRMLNEKKNADTSKRLLILKASIVWQFSFGFERFPDIEELHPQHVRR